MSNMSPIQTARELQEISAKNAALKQRYAELADWPQAPEPPELRKLNALIEDSRILAARNPLFAAARSHAAYRPVLPLEPGGTTPMVAITEASADLETLLNWWAQWPEANVGTVVGPHTDLLALRVSGPEAWDSLIRFGTVEYHDEDSDRIYSERLEFGGGRITIGEAPKPVRVRGGSFWGRKQEREVMEALRDQRPRLSVIYFAWSYPEESALAAMDYPERHLADGLDVLGTGTVLPLAGRLMDGPRIDANLPAPQLMRLPSWMAQRLGKPARKRRGRETDKQKAASGR